MDDFWRTKTLGEMTTSEWEHLCDGCGKCCLHKIIDANSDEITYTRVACHRLDIKTGRCLDYGRRRRVVADCVQITTDALDELKWLPATCAYRLLWEGKELPWWHPLVSGNRRTVDEAGQSVGSRGAIPELRRASDRARLAQMVEHIVDWPD
ncbi:MAG: YcgN family cysteine cluster protein [Alphaproteobacteria bacterium]|nr:YcgN family cysteine cluster protein [Alphaproteobacteria bacterium]